MVLDAATGLPFHDCPALNAGPRCSVHAILFPIGEHGRTAAFELRPSDWWTSPKTGARYPVGWRISVPSLGVDLLCAAAIPDQELAGDGET